MKNETPASHHYQTVAETSHHFPLHHVRALLQTYAARYLVKGECCPGCSQEILGPDDAVPVFRNRFSHWYCVDKAAALPDADIPENYLRLLKTLFGDDHPPEGTLL